VAGQPPFGAQNTTAAKISGGSLLANWTHRQSSRSQTELRVSTVDVDFHHELKLSESNDLVWGLGFRDTSLPSLHTSGTSYCVLFAVRPIMTH
jgi:hypothetical protein